MPIVQKSRTEVGEARLGIMMVVMGMNGTNWDCWSFLC